MSTPAAPTVRAQGGIRVIGWLVCVAGVILAAAGVFTWFVVRGQLSDEKITVSSDAAHFAGQPVDGPLTAYAQAEVISKHALEASGGKTYAQLPQGDPTRQTVMTASFLRASLYTSVVAFGVAAMAVGLGVVLLLVGIALVRLAGRQVLLPAVAGDEVSTTGPPVRRHAGVPADEEPVAAEAPAAAEAPPAVETPPDAEAPPAAGAPRAAEAPPVTEAPPAAEAEAPPEGDVRR